MFDYESPINVFQKQIEMQVERQIENHILKAVSEVGVSVDKEELLKALKYDREQYERGYQDGVNYAIDVYVGNNWIPCSERLPEEPIFADEGYIVQQKYVREPFTAYWDGEKWTDVDGEEEDNILAWQPLPAPYKGGNDND